MKCPHMKYKSVFLYLVSCYAQGPHLLYTTEFLESYTLKKTKGTFFLKTIVFKIPFGKKIILFLVKTWLVLGKCILRNENFLKTSITNWQGFSPSELILLYFCKKKVTFRDGKILFVCSCGKTTLCHGRKEARQARVHTEFLTVFASCFCKQKQLIVICTGIRILVNFF